MLRAIVAELVPHLPALLADKRAGASLLAQYVQANAPASASSTGGAPSSAIKGKPSKAARK